MTELWRFLKAGGLGMVLALAACRPLAAAPEVVVTIKPVHALAAAVMEGVGTPALLMEGAASPHSYQMRPSDAQLLSRADLVVWVGRDVESAFPDMRDMLPSDVQVVEVMAMAGLTLLPARESGIRLGEAGSDDPHAEHGHGPLDPHVWLDPANAQVIVQRLAESLGVADPDHAAAYRENAERMTGRLRSLDAELRATLAPVSEVPFMTFHDGFQYFEAAYGLNSVASVAIGPERLPGMRTVLELRREIARRGVRCLFAEPQYDPQLAQTLLEGTHARLGRLDPLGIDLPAGPRAYEALMRELAADTMACMVGGAAD